MDGIERAVLWDGINHSNVSGVTIDSATTNGVTLSNGETFDMPTAERATLYLNDGPATASKPVPRPFVSGVAARQLSPLPARH